MNKSTFTSFRFSQGFSLIEMLVVVAIVAILSATAMVAYEGYVQRAQRSEAQSVLMDLAQRLERHYTDNNSYDGFDIPETMDRLPANPDRVATYTFLVDVADDGQSFVIEATAQNNQADDGCGSLTLDHAGRRTSEIESVNCW